MSEPQKDALWYKDAIIYQLHVKAFFDSTNDGIGDFPGLTAKLDYLEDLGVNTLWLLPFYPSPLKDDGYDIADYYNVNPAYGTIEDFKEFVKQAHSRGMRVITELVINHTSDQHPWFQRARLAPRGSVERDFYVWNDDDKKWPETRIIFTDTETSNWAWDPVAEQYYWHRFFSHQPDLNFDNPAVLDEVIKAMYFWLDMGVDGLRLDAVPYLVERDGTSNENNPETHIVIKKIRAALEERYPDRLLLAEANMWPEDVLPYFGDGDECHMAFHFPLMPRIYMAVAQEDRHPITDILYQTPEIPSNCQWAMFLRNHDELTLEMVTDRERDYLWNFYAADKRARINIGIRRRLAPLMDNDRRKIELLNGLLMSMPGTPVVYYGDELGMGDNIFLGDRNGVRTPMQWSSDRNGGFSKADPAELYLPAIMDPVYGFQSINAEAQARTPNSLYNWTRNLLNAVKIKQAFGRGSIRMLRPHNRKVLAYLREHDGETILCVANLSRAPQPVELDLKEFHGRIPVEMLGNSTFPSIGDLPYFLTLSPYGFFWFHLTERTATHDASPTLPELSTLVIPRGWDSLATNQTFEQQVLPAFLMRQRWYKAHDQSAPSVKLLTSFPLGNFQICITQAELPNGKNQYYIIACGIAWETMTDDPSLRLAPCTIARVRQNNKVGILYEASQNEDFIKALLVVFNKNEKLQTAQTRLLFNANLPDIEIATTEVKSLGAEQTNSSVKIGDSLIYKTIRQPEAGINPEEEMGRFLTEASPFARVPKLIGSIHLQGLSDQDITVGILQEAVRNQGDGWKVTLEYLERLTSDMADIPYYSLLAENLGKRTAELHQALAKETTFADFSPEPIISEDVKQWTEGTLINLDLAFGYIQRVLAQLPDHAHAIAEQLLSDRYQLEAQIHGLLRDVKAQKIRVHGDYHLGQVLIAENDFYIIDFEGEPVRSLKERRQKYAPEKDVAGMIRSFDYARATALRQTDIHSDTYQKHAAILSAWYQEAVRSFLSGYGNSDEKLLTYFLIDKALYEIVYEALHRPDWLEIPMTGLLNLLKEARHG